MIRTQTVWPQSLVFIPTTCFLFSRKDDIYFVNLVSRHERQKGFVSVIHPNFLSLTVKGLRFYIRLAEFCQENMMVIANMLFQQPKISTHGHHCMVNAEIILIMFLAAKDGKALKSAKTRPGVDCGSDQELLIAKFWLKLRK